MKTKYLMIPATMLIALTTGNAIAQDEGHSKGTDASPQHEMMKNMMEKMHHCMMDMKPDEGMMGMKKGGKMGMKSKSSEDKEVPSSGNMMNDMKDMKVKMMAKMESCMMKMDAQKEEKDSKSKEHKH